MNYNKLLNFFDMLIIVALCTTLLIAFSYQFTVNDLPCAMCVMSRMGVYAMSFGLLANLLLSRNTKNYLLVIIAGLIQMAISLEFIVRHIVPGSGSYGSPVFGLHMYSWNFIFTVLIIIYCCIAGLISNNISNNQNKPTLILKLIIALLFLTLFANTISTFVECGIYSCPSDPHSYWLLDLLHR
ncbi:MAG: disulfide bond formation protein B [Neisseriales bacterium]|nr:MAG: disulfide bond formation protein B [Neisseriales bacterium]